MVEKMSSSFYRVQTNLLNVFTCILLFSSLSSVSVSSKPYPELVSELELQVRDNLLQLEESVGSDLETNSPGKPYLLGREAKSEKQHFQKFEKRRSIPSSDAIVFPSSQSANYDRPFADRYNKHRPNIPTPQRPLPFNFAFGLPSETVDPPKSQSPQQPTENLLSPEQESVLQQTVMQLFRGILFTPSEQPRPQRSYRKFQQRTTQPNYSEASPAPESTSTFSTAKDEELDGVRYQSLYSGPRVEKSPCVNGQHRTHGSCREKSRRLLNSYG